MYILCIYYVYIYYVYIIYYYIFIIHIVFSHYHYLSKQGTIQADHRCQYRKNSSQFFTQLADGELSKRGDAYELLRFAKPSARVRNDIDQDCQQTAPESASLDEQTKEDPETLEVGGPTSNSHEWNRSVSTVML